MDREKVTFCEMYKADFNKAFSPLPFTVDLEVLETKDSARRIN